MLSVTVVHCARCLFHLYADPYCEAALWSWRWMHSKSCRFSSEEYFYSVRCMICNLKLMWPTGIFSIVSIFIITPFWDAIGIFFFWYRYLCCCDLHFTRSTSRRFILFQLVNVGYFTCAQSQVHVYVHQHVLLWLLCALNLLYRMRRQNWNK